jgi:hypothetical protein
MVTLLVVAVAVFGPALFMASSPCLDCDGVCGTAATIASADITATLLWLSVAVESKIEIVTPPVRLAELPPRSSFLTA